MFQELDEETVALFSFVQVQVDTVSELLSNKNNKRKISWINEKSNLSPLLIACNTFTLRYKVCFIFMLCRQYSLSAKLGTWTTSGDSPYHSNKVY